MEEEEEPGKTEQQLTDDQIRAYLFDPELLLTDLFNRTLTENQCKQFWTWMQDHRMSQPMLIQWMYEQQKNGFWRYRCIGQVFARFAVIGKGFSTVDKGFQRKIAKTRIIRNKK